MNISLRHYQKEAITKVIESFEKGTTRQLINLPTGAGKTIVMAALAKKLGVRTLLLAHREELITQAKDKFKLVWPNAETGICMADQNEPNKQVVFGSVQSCYRDKKMEKLKENDFELLLIDEAHHASSPSYQKIIRELGFFSEDPTKLLVGVTATPMRSDDKALGETFSEITYSLSIGTMIKGGYLAPVIGRKILTQMSIDGVQTLSGDFALGSLSEAINTSNRNKFIAENYKKYAINRKGIVFCCDVQHCKDIAEAFLKADIPTKSIYGDMDTIERKKSLEALKTGEIQVVTSCGVLTEGFDEPTIGCVVMARPTKFRGLFIQCVGRGLRLHPSKSDCLVLDFSDEGHNLEAIATLTGIIPEATHIGDSKEEKESREHTINIRRVCDEEFDILGGARFIWIPIGDDQWSLSDDEGDEIVMSPGDGGYGATVYWKNGEEQPIMEEPLPLDYCSGTCEDYARAHFKLNFASADAPWLTSELAPTNGQTTFLQKNGVETNKMTKAQASMKIREVIAKRRKHYRQMKSEPITPKQAYFLQGQGVDPKSMSKLDAIRAIGKIKKGGITANT